MAEAMTGSASRLVSVVSSTSPSSPEECHTLPPGPGSTSARGGVTDRNMSVFTFDVPAVGTNSLTVQDIATYIGRGLAFSNDWGMDGTLSCLLES